MEYCSIVYYWESISLSQELSQLLHNRNVRGRNEFIELSKKDWNNFLREMAQERWELAGAVSLVDTGVSKETIAYFKRSC